MGIAARYAKAAFDLAKEGNAVSAIEADVDALSAAVAQSADFNDLIQSPLYGHDEQAAAIAALAPKMGLSATMTSVLGLMAQKRRLFVLPQLLGALRALIADDKGEMTAEVTSAQAMTPAQTDALVATLSRQFGKTVKIKASVDETLIGGLIVKVGSKMIDTSIRAKLNSLQNAMKEVG